MPGRRLLPLLLAAALLLALAGTAQAAPTQVILVEGEHIGTILNVQTHGPAVVRPRRNPITKADGALAGAAADCPEKTAGGKAIGGTHYHGTLFKRPDPDPTHCGWGRVILADQASALFRYGADAIGDELVIAAEIRRAKPDYGSIGGLALRSRKWIERELNKLQDAGNAQTITPDQFNMAKASLDRAVERDEGIEEIAGKVQSGKLSEAEAEGQVRRKVESGLIAKRNALKVLPQNVFIK